LTDRLIESRVVIAGYASAYTGSTIKWVTALLDHAASLFPMPATSGLREWDQKAIEATRSDLAELSVRDAHTRALRYFTVQYLHSDDAAKFDAALAILNRGIISSWIAAKDPMGGVHLVRWARELAGLASSFGEYGCLNELEPLIEAQFSVGTTLRDWWQLGQTARMSEIKMPLAKLLERHSPMAALSFLGCHPDDVPFHLRKAVASSEALVATATHLLINGDFGVPLDALSTAYDIHKQDSTHLV
jgi:hypothetical protein